jgi:hypothetical protein
VWALQLGKGEKNEYSITRHINHKILEVTFNLRPFSLELDLTSQPFYYRQTLLSGRTTELGNIFLSFNNF